MKLSNKRLISRSRKEEYHCIIIYYEKNNKYSEDYIFFINHDGFGNQIIQTKENEIC